MHDHERVFRMRHDGRWVALTESHYRSMWDGIRRALGWPKERGATHPVHKGRRHLGGAHRLRAGRLDLPRPLPPRRLQHPLLGASIEEVALAVEILTGEYHALAGDSAPWLAPDAAAECAQRRERLDDDTG